MPNLLLQQGTLTNRDRFGQWLNSRGLTNTAAEIGTHRGDFAFEFLRCWKGKKLICIDPWSDVEGYEKQTEVLQRIMQGCENRLEDLEEAKRKLKNQVGRVIFHQATSAEALPSYPDKFFDFVYIDGDHSYKQVHFDLVHWWDKVKPGGVLAGHDFICPGEPDGGWGLEIQPAVVQAAKQFNATINIVVETQSLPWSFYLEKPNE